MSLYTAGLKHCESLRAKNQQWRLGVLIRQAGGRLSQRGPATRLLSLRSEECALPPHAPPPPSTQPSVTLKRILIGTKTSDKGLMKELIDKAHCWAYSPQSHSERHTNTWSFTRNGRFFKQCFLGASKLRQGDIAS